MASPGSGLLEATQPPGDSPEPALAEAQQWIEQVTGRTFGDKDFRSGLENGVLLCELLNSIKPGLVKKINRLPTPIAGLDNIALFLRGCKELGLKESQLFDPVDLQDNSSKATVRNLDCSRKLKNVLVTIYWLGKTANSSTGFSGATLNLREFEGLLTQLRKHLADPSGIARGPLGVPVPPVGNHCTEETEDVDSPKRSIRDSGYVDCWDSERSDSLSPPRHGRDDSFDSLDSFGSRSQQTPSPDVVLRGSSDGRGSDSESDLPHRKLPDVKKDDMSARRTSYGEPKSVVPFNQYLPNKSNQTAYIPAPLRKKKAEREEFRKSWSTATSPLGGERPFSKRHPETIKEEQTEVLAQSEEECLGCRDSTASPSGKPVETEVNQGEPLRQSSTPSANKAAGPRNPEKDPKELGKLRRIEQAGIKIMPALQRYGSSQLHMCEMDELMSDIILRKENPFMLSYQRKDSGSEDERDDRIPDLEKDDFAIRRARLNQPKLTLPFNQYLLGSYANKDRGKVEEGKKPKETQECSSGQKMGVTSARPMVVCEDKPFLQSQKDESKEKDQPKFPDVQRDDLAKRKTQASPSQLDLSCFVRATITQAVQDTWDRLKVSGKTSDEELTNTPGSFLTSETAVEAAGRNCFASHKVRTSKKASIPKQRFVHFGPVTEIDLHAWEKLSIARAAPKDDMEEAANRERAGALGTSAETSSLLSVSHVNSLGHPDDVHRLHANPSEIMDACNSSLSDACADSQKQTASSLSEWHESSEEEVDGSFPDIERDDMLARRFGTFQKSTSPVRPSCPPISVVSYHPLKQQGKERKALQKAERSSPLTCATQHCLGTPSPVSLSSVATCGDGLEKPKDQDEHRTNAAGGKAGVRNPGNDDMMVRRSRDFPKQTGPSVSQFLPVPFSKQQDGGEATKDLVKTEQKVKSITVTDSAVPEKHPELCAESPQRLSVQPEHKLEDGKPRVPGVRQDGASSAAHKDLLDSKLLQPGDSSEVQLTEKHSQGFTSLMDGHAQTFGSRTPVSDDAESVSMFDMRCADEAAVMQPHSQARHEKLQTIHHQLKEEEDQWQDDLARWKSRRRSASQDLFKKEAERKKMERLLTGTEEATEWRKSIKTYREIVEEKERRERALHEAYKNARSREEADNILQQYIERFTISEAVLERLEMPKILERSHSAEPNSSSPPKDPNPMRYLRQQSLPAPKYTAKVEATIAPAGGSEASISTGRTSPSKAFVSKAVPMLTAKPYSQPKSTQQVLRTFKVDGKVSMNGEAVNGVEEERERECTTLIFAPSPSRSPKSNSVVDGSSVEGEQNSPSTELVLKRLIEHSKDRAQAGTLMEEAKSINQNEKTDSERLSPDHKEFSTTVSRASPTVAVAEFSSVTNSSLSNHRKEMGSNEEPKKLERGQLKDVEAPVIQKVETLEAPVPDGGIIVPLLKIIPERSQVVLQNSAPQAGTDNSDKSNRFGCWSWDPEEERKRQEQWQHEQERVLQERYQKEQDKLKEEWEKAQKEVEEEERKYYEEERKIIEDTVVPFTVTSSSAEPLSTSSSVTDGNGTVNMVDVSYSEEEDKQKEDRTRKNLFSEQEGVPFSKSKEYEPGKENMSTVNKEEYIGTSKQRGNEQDPQMSRTERLQPTEMTLPLCQDVTWNQQLLTKQSPRVSDTKQKNFPSEHNLGLPVSSAREMRRAGCRESSGAGRSSSSPCSPTTQRQSPNRSVSGKKLCSSCGQPLGKGAAMIIETLGLYFHIQCFRCGICKGQLGDAASGTDVRIRSGLLNCNDCYIRSRTAGQPTTL
ncbi:LIM and calponin homology domains-containing protein 1 isoform X2 [Zootoca vivipara]|uniref:LIM and calponin homology domains-containing protein 1 isoform X2 n=1 Tax=Zootoca vivipara TaxID=8524 RepID=UPI00293BA3D3|nr:LIM and calponin homology domains-containing protein 1 isoform X2 [Zootoca vivipara]